jgi:hypothetical protein
MDDAFAVCVPKAGADLFDVFEGSLCLDALFTTEALKIAARQILKNKVMKRGSLKIASGSMPKTTDYVRMSDTVKSDRLVLKILDQRPFEVIVEVVLQKDVQCFNDDGAVRRVWRCQHIASDKYLSIASAAELLDYVVTLVQSAII